MVLTTQRPTLFTCLRFHVRFFFFVLLTEYWGFCFVVFFPHKCLHNPMVSQHRRNHSRLILTIYKLCSVGLFILLHFISPQCRAHRACAYRAKHINTSSRCYRWTATVRWPYWDYHVLAHCFCRRCADHCCYRFVTHGRYSRWWSQPPPTYRDRHHHHGCRRVQQLRRFQRWPPMVARRPPAFSGPSLLPSRP